MADYVYKEIDNTVPRIRVLELFPAPNMEADIHCELQELQLSDSQRTDRSFEALSYVWGSDERPNLVYINNHQLPITSNLDNALRHLRRKSQKRRLWVDAICINQDNRPEKSTQILLMRRIFAEASRVLIWLGPGDEDTDKAIAVLAQKAEDQNQTSSVKDLLRPVLPGLEKIFTRSWWSRMWVYEEAVVASRCPLVICGQSQIEWTSLNQEELRWDLMLDFYEERPNIRDIHIRGTQEFMDYPNSYYNQTPEQRRQRVSLFTLLKATCHRHAFDARDKIYAVLGLVTDGSADHVQPDYTASVSQVYQAATLAILNSEEKFDILHRVHSPSRLADLPTWCPDFSTGEWGSFERGDHFFPLGDTTRFAADQGIARQQVTHNASSESIKIRGVEVSRITSARASSFTSAVIAEYWTRVRNGMRMAVIDDAINTLELEWSEIAERIHSVLTETMGIDEANRKLAKGEAWRILSAGRPLYQFADLKPENQLRIADSEFEDGYWLFEKDLRDRQAGLPYMNHMRPNNMRPWSDLISNQDVPNLQAWSMSYQKEIVQSLEDTSFFVTENDLYGISACCVEKHDILCVLFGCRLPAILRQREDKYQLVSFAYIPAIMNGELFTGKDETEIEMETFELV
ncbi:hypothetical protein AtubIFM57258_003124 [Aspergillus tubingensis]|nr:hypothetical protein AtubIFM57258_003124 [Aspergillus tubingensis]